jgi:hypothetical protein
LKKSPFKAGRILFLLSDLNTLENKGMGAKRKKRKSEPVAPLSPTLIDISG